MRKLLFILLVVLVIAIVAQKFGLLTYFPNNSRLVTEKQTADTSIIKISQTINRPIIGIHYRMIDKQTALANKLVEGAYISQIIQGSPAEKANLQEEDIITEVDGRSISGLDEQSVYNLISTLKPGSKVNLKIWRNKKIINAFVTLD